MRLTSTIRKIHERNPKLGKAVSLATATGVIAANSFGGSIPLWLMGVGKVITGAPIADKAVIKIATYWISSNSALIDDMLPRKDWRISLPMTCTSMANICWSATISLGSIPVSCSTLVKNACH